MSSYTCSYRIYNPITRSHEPLSRAWVFEGFKGLGFRIPFVVSSRIPFVQWPERFPQDLFRVWGAGFRGSQRCCRVHPRLLEMGVERARALGFGIVWP